MRIEPQKIEKNIAMWIRFAYSNNNTASKLTKGLFSLKHFALTVLFKFINIYLPFFPINSLGFIIHNNHG
jgi:hypothetical protein